MMTIRLVGISAIALVAVCATLARAEDISAKKVFIKDNADATKRLIQAQSVDVGVQFSEADDPSANGAALHVYSATDDFCAILPPGTDWVSKNNKVWKYKNKGTKNTAQVKNGKLAVKIKAGVTYTLSDNGTQGTVNVQVQFGAGTRYCMRCTGNKKDEAFKFLGKDCVAAACDAEPSSCNPPIPTTTTSTMGIPTTTSSTTPQTPGIKGALTPTLGRFNYNAAIGLPAANAACNTNFAGTHACTYAELQSAEAAGDLVGLKDTANTPVTSFWAIDSSQPVLQQCQDDAAGGSLLNWEYATAHTLSRGEKVALTNATGALGVLQMSQLCSIGGTASWVGCCH
jgi:hypothetical protein